MCTLDEIIFHDSITNYSQILDDCFNTLDQPVEKVMAGDGVGWWGCCNLLMYLGIQEYLVIKL